MGSSKFAADDSSIIKTSKTLIIYLRVVLKRPLYLRRMPFRRYAD
jgi:hypothetical protein